MAVIPAASDTTLSRIWKSWESNAKPRHSRRLGASVIGNECSRQIWYGFRWAKLDKFSGRILRLFDTGKLEEDRVIVDLKCAGVDVKAFDPETGAQWEFSELGDHFTAKLDGAAQGFVESSAWHVLEVKSSNQKAFDKLQKEGVQKAKPAHYAQCVVGMGLSGMDRAVYLAVNKNTDEIWFERIKFDKEEYNQLIQRAKEIIFCGTAPSKISESPAWWQCKCCDYYAFCQGVGAMAEKNCRTCRESEALEDGGWGCKKLSKVLSMEDQATACGEHVYIVGMVSSAVNHGS